VCKGTEKLAQWLETGAGNDSRQYSLSGSKPIKKRIVENGGAVIPDLLT
jgi:hypothetical protein